jgi:uncharacterized protein YjbI with pentapeptide repeats
MTPYPSAGDDLSGCDLSGAHFGIPYVSPAPGGRILDGLILTDANLTGATLWNVRLDGADLTGANLTGLNSLYVTGTPDLPTGWKLFPTFVGPGNTLSGGVLLGPTAGLSGQTGLIGANFNGWDLSGVSLAGTYLSHASFDGANLTAADLSGAHAQYADFKGATVTGTDLSGVDMLQTDVSGLDLRGAMMVAPAFMAHVKAVGTNLSGNNLSGTQAFYSDFTGADLLGVDLTGANITSATFTNADLTGAKLTSVVDGAINGQKYPLATWSGATCPDGRTAAAHRESSCLLGLDHTAPTISTTVPASVLRADRRVTVSWVARDTGGSTPPRTDVRYRSVKATGGTWGSWRLWRTATTTSSAALTVSLGYRYCFSARARDAAGNTTAWTPDRCLTAPVDDRALAARTSGWTRASASGFLVGTYTSTTRPGSVLATPGASYVRQIGLVATRCPTCGTVAVYVGSKRIGTVRLLTSGSSGRAVVMLPRLSTRVYGKVRLVVTSGQGQPVILDGLIRSAS